MTPRGTLRARLRLFRGRRLRYWLSRIAAPARIADVPQAEARAHTQYLCLRVRAAGEAHWVSRIRRALAVGEGNQPDGRAGAGPWAWHAHPRARNRAAGRHRSRFPQLFG